MTGLRAEPVAVIGVARAVIYMLMTFGLIKWTDMQVDAVMAVVGLAVVPVVEGVTGYLLRSKVTSDDTLKDAGTNRREVVLIAANDDMVLRPQMKELEHV